VRINLKWRVKKRKGPRKKRKTAGKGKSSGVKPETNTGSKACRLFFQGGRRLYDEASKRSGVKHGK